MSGTPRPIPRRLLVLALCAFAARVAAAPLEAPPPRFGEGCCALAAGRCVRPVLVVFSAFPAELAPLLERAEIHETMLLGDRVLRVGTLEGVPVVLGLLGIGYANALEVSRLVLDHFDVAGVVVSGVAGSSHRIGDVTVPATWTGPDGIAHPADSRMLAIATKVAEAGVSLERCTEVPPSPPGPSVCLSFDPAIFVGGAGQTDDPYGNQRLACMPNSGWVFGCDVVPDDPGRGLRYGTSDVTYVAVDQETAAVAGEAQARGIPFIGFRAVSDGPGDPLGLPGFPSQFFAYYRLSARNAAAATTAFVKRWGKGRRVRGGRIKDATDARASCDWMQLAAPACAGRRSPTALRAIVSSACASLAGGADPATAAQAWTAAADLAGTPKLQHRLGRACGRDLEPALRARSAP